MLWVQSILIEKTVADKKIKNKIKGVSDGTARKRRWESSDTGNGERMGKVLWIDSGAVGVGGWGSMRARGVWALK